MIPCGRPRGLFAATLKTSARTGRRVGWRTDRMTGEGDTESMNKLPLTVPNLHRSLMSAGLAALVFVAAVPASQIVNAQSSVRAPAGKVASDPRHAKGLALERRGDEKGAFVAFLAAAEGGYPPAQRKLGEIYDSGNAAVERNYEESIRWYQKAREGGEQIPPPKSPIPNVIKSP